MPFAVYDYRKDIKNVLVTPHIRSRFLSMEPGAVASLHSHDLGHEIFLILQGQCEFNIEGDIQVLGPGQMCVALSDEMHQVRVIGDEQMIMYLSVTPHIHPTHTGRNEDGSPKDIRFAPQNAYDQEPAADSIEDNIDRHVQAAQDLARAARESAQIQKNMAEKLKQALENGDKEAAENARNTMWKGIYQVYKSIYAQGEPWNDLAPRAVPNE
ncbi:MAG: cupin domain-containing protein [bacterium]|nr:cupin domain-containing protein [bacterium]